MKMSALAAILCLVATVAKASPPPAQYTTPNANPASYVDNAQAYGASTYYVETSTPSDTPVLLGSGPGLLYSINCSSGAAGDYGNAYDSAMASGLTILTQGHALSPAVLSSANGSTTCTAGQVCGQWSPANGHASARFHNGLAFLKHGSATGGSCLVEALFDSEVTSSH